MSRVNARGLDEEEEFKSHEKPPESAVLSPTATNPRKITQIVLFLAKKVFSKRTYQTQRDEQLMWGLQTRAWLAFCLFSGFRVIYFIMGELDFDERCGKQQVDGGVLEV